jgi:hypothetical protein
VGQTLYKLLDNSKHIRRAVLVLQQEVSARASGVWRLASANCLPLAFLLLASWLDTPWLTGHTSVGLLAWHHVLRGQAGNMMVHDGT